MSKKLITFIVLTAQQHFFSLNGVDKVLNPGKPIELPEDDEYVKSLEAQGFIVRKETTAVMEAKAEAAAKLREDMKNALNEVGITPTEAEIDSYLKMSVTEFTEFLASLKAKTENVENNSGGTADEELDHEVTQEDLDANPELGKGGVKVGDKIKLPVTKKDYSDMKFDELKAEAEARGLAEKIKGMQAKKDIAAVLEADDQSKINN